MSMVASKEMNLSSLKEIFTEEYLFLSEAFSRCRWPKPVESDNESESSDETEDALMEGDVKTEISKSNSAVKAGQRNIKSLDDKKQRAGTIGELLQKHEQIRSTENRKRKKEEQPKKSKVKNKKKKKKAPVDNSTNIKTEGEGEIKTIKDEPCMSDGRSEETLENKKQSQPKKITRVPLKHGADVIVNDAGSMLFSKVAFSNSVDELKSNPGGPKQPKHILGKLEKMNSLISSLEERGKKEKAQRLKENMSWSNAFFKAEGAKVKDNTKKVIVSVKQLEKRKRASERKWKKRLQEIENKKETRSRKRESHIQKRVDQKKERKLKKLIRRGRFVPDLKTKPS